MTQYNKAIIARAVGMLAAGISPRSVISSLLKDAKHDKHAAARAKFQAEQAAV